MFVYGIVLLVVGIGLITGALALIVGLHRRFRLPYALLTVGMLTFTGALLAQVIVLRAVDRGLLGILPIGALTLGLAAGFSEEIARLLGYQYLARSTVTKPQAIMIGAGHSLFEVVYPGFLAIGLGLKLMGYSTDRPDDLPALVSGALSESLNGLLPVLMHMALSWIVLQVFLRGELYWLFVAIFCHTIVEIMTVLLGPNDAWSVVVWRGVVALISLAVIVRLRPPGQPKSL